MTASAQASTPPGRPTRLTFLGAAGTVTGSKYLVEHEGHRVLVDCGLFQGYKALRLLNWEPLPFDAAALDAVVLTHAHLDHSGALPLLVKQGLRSPVFASAATRDLCELLLPDSGRIQEEDALYASRHHTSRHDPVLPLYTEDDARRALQRIEPLPFDEPRELAPGIVATLRPAGHILGAASVQLQLGASTLLFSGDIGRSDDLLMSPPAPISHAGVLIVESTYGDSVHESQEVAQAALGEAIAKTAARGGTIVIPAFAVGRAQLLLWMIDRLKRAGRIANLPVYLDSPMAVDTTAIYRRHRGDHRLSAQEWRDMSSGATMVRTVDESKALAQLHVPAVIISASGMATGGRVLHHLKNLLPDRRNAVLLAGYQAGGTRGARLARGERTLRIFGEDVPVRAEVIALPGMSAHADAPQLIEWMRTAPSAPRRVFVTHGEPDAADALRQRIERQLGWPATVPILGQSVELPA